MGRRLEESLQSVCHELELAFDVTERAERLEQAATLKADALRREKEIITIVNHGFRSRIAHVREDLKYFLDSGNFGAEPKLRRRAEVMLSVLSGLAKDIEKTMILRTMDYGTFKLSNPTVFELGPALEFLCHELRPAAEHCGLELTLQKNGLPPGDLVTGHLDELRIVLRELAENAIKYTKSGHVNLVVEMLHQEVNHGMRHYLFCVEDTGPGIPSEDSERIFEPFVRGRASAGTSGFGLGLSGARKLVQLMDGRLTVNSGVGKGSRFEFTLGFWPALPAETRLTDSRSETGESGNVILRPEVLVIDDDRYLREAIVRKFTLFGWSVKAFALGRSAVEECRMARPDLIFTDIMMPEEGLDGYQTCRVIHNLQDELNQARTPIIAMSCGSVDGELKKRFHGVLPKEALLDCDLEAIGAALEGTGIKALLAGFRDPLRMKSSEPEESLAGQPTTPPLLPFGERLIDDAALRRRCDEDGKQQTIAWMEELLGGFELQLQQLETAIRNSFHHEVRMLAHEIVGRLLLVQAGSCASLGRVLETVAHSEAGRDGKHRQEQYRLLFELLSHQISRIGGEIRMVLARQP